LKRNYAGAIAALDLMVDGLVVVVIHSDPFFAVGRKGVVPL